MPSAGIDGDRLQTLRRREGLPIGDDLACKFELTAKNAAQMLPGEHLAQAHTGRREVVAGAIADSVATLKERTPLPGKLRHRGGGGVGVDEGWIGDRCATRRIVRSRGRGLRNHRKTSGKPKGPSEKSNRAFFHPARTTPDQRKGRPPGGPSVEDAAAASW